jgi:N-acetylglutamate synthase/N-acetylornithine aminotransferase
MATLMNDSRAQSSPDSSQRLTKANSEDLHFTHLITVFAVSTGMVGVCLTAMGIVQLVAHTAQLQTRCDDLLMVDSAILLFATISSFISMRLRFHGPWKVFSHIADVLLLIGIAIIALGAVLLAIEF